MSTMVFFIFHRCQKKNTGSQQTSLPCVGGLLRSRPSRNLVELSRDPYDSYASSSYDLG